MKYDFDRVITRAGTHCVKWDHHEMHGEVEGIIPMSIADMDFEAPAFIKDAIIERAAHGVFGYTVVPQSYYSAVSGWVERRFGWKVEREWVRFSPGVIPALAFSVQAFTELEDRVIIQPPVYHPFRAVIANNGRVVLNNPLIRENGEYRMDLEGLKRSIDKKTRMIILSSPHNPVGRVWKEDELKALIDICLENNIIIISDEIHSDLIMPGFRHTPTASLSDEAASITITCTSPSKTFNLAELHVANIIIPNEGLFSRFDLALTRTGINKPNIIGMVSLEAAYNKGDAWLDELIPYLHANYLLMRDFVKEQLPQINAAHMEGTYLGWLDFNGLGLSEAQLDELLLTRAKVAMTPGRIFGPGGEGFYRMNLACPRTLVAEALKRIELALRSI